MSKKKEIVTVDAAAPNPNLSPATRFGDLVFVAGQTGRHELRHHLPHLLADFMGRGR